MRFLPLILLAGCAVEASPVRIDPPPREVIESLPVEAEKPAKLPEKTDKPTQQVSDETYQVSCRCPAEPCICGADCDCEHCNSLPVITVFGAEWCGPCHEMQAANGHTDGTFRYVYNFDEASHPAWVRAKGYPLLYWEHDGRWFSAVGRKSADDVKSVYEASKPRRVEAVPPEPFPAVGWFGFGVCPPST